jgi:hypothetical protein
MPKKAQEPRPLSKAEQHYLESLVGVKSLGEMASDLDRSAAEIEVAYKKARAKSPGKFGRPSEGVTIMTEAASIEGDEHGKANRAANDQFIARYANCVWRGNK